jgi:hypothetical protein
MDVTQLVHQQIKDWIERNMPTLVVAALRREKAEREASIHNQEPAGEEPASKP